MSNSSILIVEDNAVFRKTLRSLLIADHPQINVAEAENATEAMDKVRTSRPDLIFMDINLPHMNGLELTRQIKSVLPEVSVFIITNYDSPEYRDAAVQAGANGFFSKKSSSLNDLIEAMESIISAKNT